MEANQQTTMIHVIPADEADHGMNGPPQESHQHGIANLTHARPVAAFHSSSVAMERLGSMVIHQQATSINRRLLNVQKRVHEEDMEERLRKIPRTGGDMTTPEKEDDDGEEEQHLESEEQLAIFAQVERMQRMTHYLNMARIAQEKFMREMASCLDDDDNPFV